jgi:hypothetical protein
MPEKFYDAQVASRLAVEPAVTCVPGLGSAWELIGGYGTMLERARFVGTFALTVRGAPKAAAGQRERQRV